MRRDRLTRQLLKTAQTYDLFVSGESVLLAVSGGADSMALLYAMHALQGDLSIRPTVVHLDHGLRGKAAQETARMVTETAETLGLPCIQGRTRVAEIAKRNRISIEMAARRARHKFFSRCLRESGAAAVVLAHTADDQAETVLLKLLRGAGSGGLSGMAYRTAIDGLPLLRPMLDLHRADVTQYLRRLGVDWHEDKTNRDLAIPRNRVRHELLPLLESHYNPGIRNALCRTAAGLAGDEAVLDNMTLEALDRCIDGDDLRVEPLVQNTVGITRRILRTWLHAKSVPAESITFEFIERLRATATAKRGSRRVEFGAGNQVICRYGKLVLERTVSQSTAFRFVVPRRGIVERVDLGLRVECRVGGAVVRTIGRGPGQLPAMASISRTALHGRQLVCRSWQAGDRLVLQHGSKKLQDIFVDAKVPIEKRAHIPLFVCREEIVWIPGYQVATAFHVTAGDTAIQLAIQPFQ